MSIKNNISKTFFFLLLMPGYLFSQETSADKTASVNRTSNPPVIDGVLDDITWSTVTPIDDFHLIRPTDGGVPSERTEVFITYDDNYLYVAAQMYDSQPELTINNILLQNSRLGQDDRIAIIIDPFNTGRGGYRFETNANGVRHDMLYQNVSQMNPDWQVIWEVDARINELGWAMEMRIPFKTLPFDNNVSTWGFNFARSIRRRGEEMVWVSRNRSYNPGIVGKVSGFTGMDQGMGLDIVPSFLLNARENYKDDFSSTSAEPSLDAFYRITPSLNASITINTDFSATEVDDRQVDLSRFGLFFPEKRDFFLNDSDLFEFGGLGGAGRNQNAAASRSARENGRPFFSRRIGLDANSQPADITAGTKISGRAGDFSIGAIAIRQGGGEGVDYNDLFVSNVSMNILSESSIGMVMTKGDPRSGADNSVAGIDFNYLNTRIGGGRVLQGDLWYQESRTSGYSEDQAAYGMSIKMPNNDGWRGDLVIKQIDSNFFPALGYVNRKGIRDTTLGVGYTHYLRGSIFNRVYSGIDTYSVESLATGNIETEVRLFRIAELETTTRDVIRLRAKKTTEILDEPFDIYEDLSRTVTIATGEYTFTEVNTSINFAGFRKLFGSYENTMGDFYTGDITGHKVVLGINFSRNLVTNMSFDWRKFELPEGQFISRLSSLKLSALFSTELAWINLIQYDNVSETFGLNSRLQWTPEAGKEVFIVINHNIEDPDKNNRFEKALSDLSVKLNYTYRF
jgi:hypothetical protein